MFIWLISFFKYIELYICVGSLVWRLKYRFVFGVVLIEWGLDCRFVFSVWNEGLSFCFKVIVLNIRGLWNDVGLLLK